MERCQEVTWGDIEEEEEEGNRMLRDLMHIFTWGVGEVLAVPKTMNKII